MPITADKVCAPRKKGDRYDIGIYRPRYNSLAPCRCVSALVFLIIVDLRINETLQTGAVENRPYRSPVW